MQNHFAVESLACALVGWVWFLVAPASLQGWALAILGIAALILGCVGFAKAKMRVRRNTRHLTIRMAAQISTRGERW